MLRMRILFVEDDPRMRLLVRRGLLEEGHVVDSAGSTPSALELARETPYNVLVIDVMLPGPSGLDLVRSLRVAGNRTPAMMLTARDAATDVVAGLDAGADDYLTKPFAFKVLLARLRALVRRPPLAHEGVLQVADLRLDDAAHTVRRGGEVVALTRTEYNLLELFMRHPRQVLTRSQIYERVWDYDFGPLSNSLSVYIGYLRRKLEEGGEARVIQTVRGMGYVLREPAR